MAGETEALQELGLTANEAKLYFILVRLGAMKATALAAKSGLQRRTVYDTLQQLGTKGMVGKSEVSGVAVFSPSPPSSLLSFLDEKRDSAEKLLPALSRSFEAEEKAGVSVMYGPQGMKTVLEDVLALRADYCVYYGQLQIFDTLPKFFPIFNEKRKQLGIKARYMVLDTPKVRERAKLIPLATFKFIDPSAPSPGVWWTYADRLVLILAQKENVVMLIKSEALAKTFRESFEHMFNSSSQVYRGDAGMKAIMEQTLEYKEVLFIGGSGQAPERFPAYFKTSYVPRAIKANLKWLNLAHHSITKTSAAKLPFHKMRFLPKDWAYNPNVIWIYGDTVANVVWKDEPVVFVVNDRTVANAYRNYFWLMWKTAGKK
ncbi:MAG: helix-turn-helix domain-containing protein [Candidatus Micrarchaeota archaeon]|nr:helix-turn-helix domain-containing protein [Candidatus Micrarchaeota archaeon]